LRARRNWTVARTTLRFIRKTYGFRYIVILLANDEPQSYLASLRIAVKGGEAMRLAVTAGDKARQ
jgi:hypothetical protein